MLYKTHIIILIIVLTIIMTKALSITQGLFLCLVHTIIKTITLSLTNTIINTITMSHTNTITLSHTLCLTPRNINTPTMESPPWEFGPSVGI